MFKFSRMFTINIMTKDDRGGVRIVLQENKVILGTNIKLKKNIIVISAYQMVQLKETLVTKYNIFIAITLF